ncbi:DUF1515 family protein [Amorphus orientalis]|uniref:Uncharacterized protein n=1 Tax=Amorphus orientalis TaxID=649198 RepID=A0AAE3VTV0_9HYPH|nr:DUF1515 family protein [Amorphus orientalis]MDQ0317740.1 hypothetical protein [Amorphus orientalis]
MSPTSGSPLPPSEVARLYEAVGRLTASVEATRADVKRMEERSNAGLSRVYERLDTSARRMAEVEASLKSLDTSYEEDVKPTIEFVRSLRQRGVGFLAAAGIAGTGIGSVAATTLYIYWDKMIKFLQNL